MANRRRAGTRRADPGCWYCFQHRETCTWDLTKSVIPAEYLVQLRAASPATAVSSKYATRPPLQCYKTTECLLRSRLKILAFRILLFRETALMARLVVLTARERAHLRIEAITAGCKPHITTLASTAPGQYLSGQGARANAFNENTADAKRLSPLLLRALIPRRRIKSWISPYDRPGLAGSSCNRILPDTL